MKRQLSDSENDDVFDDDKTSPSQSCQMLTRKKRRGIIEKKRRDRINNSLTELRRLVPSAFEKQISHNQGSAKLEKAEILQLTVDHLKLLHSKGIDTFSFDPHKFAYDYHGVGFRECAAEVARYLVSVEGLDLQDPLRLRLMSHLQCFPAPTTTKPTTSLNGQSSSWNPHSSYNPGAPLPVTHNMQISSSSSLDAFSYEQNRFYDNSTGHHSAPPTHFPPNYASLAQPTSSSNLYSNHGQSSPSQYPVHLSSSSHHGSFQPVPSLVSYPPSTSASAMQGKPYRPWGAEIVY